jgi:hypothetical protein
MGDLLLGLDIGTSSSKAVHVPREPGCVAIFLQFAGRVTPGAGRSALASRLGYAADEDALSAARRSMTMRWTA